MKRFKFRAIRFFKEMTVLSGKLTCWAFRGVELMREETNG